jgi:hypothetical protein
VIVFACPRPDYEIEIYKTSIALTEDLFQLMDRPEDKFECYEFLVSFLHERERYMQTRVLVGANPSHHLNIITAAKIDAELRLFKLKVSMKDPEEELLNKLGPFIAAAVKYDLNDTHLKKLQKERCRERAIALAKLKELIELGKWNPQDFPDILSYVVTLSENLLELQGKPEDQLKSYEFRIEFLKYIEKFMDARVQVGSDASHRVNLAKAASLDAEIAQLKFKSTMEKPKK